MRELKKEITIPARKANEKQATPYYKPPSSTPKLEYKVIKISPWEYLGINRKMWDKLPSAIKKIEKKYLFGELNRQIISVLKPIILTRLTDESLSREEKVKIIKDISKITGYNVNTIVKSAYKLKLKNLPSPISKSFVNEGSYLDAKERNERISKILEREGIKIPDGSSPRYIYDSLIAMKQGFGLNPESKKPKTEQLEKQLTKKGFGGGKKPKYTNKKKLTPISEYMTERREERADKIANKGFEIYKRKIANGAAEYQADAAAFKGMKTALSKDKDLERMVIKSFYEKVENIEKGQ